MNDDHDFERATRAFLDDGSDRTPATTIDAVLLAVRTTPQERDLRIPWRTTTMSTPLRLFAAIAIVLIVGVAAFNLFGSSSGVGGVASPSPTAAPSAPAPTSTQSASPTPYRDQHGNLDGLRVAALRHQHRPPGGLDRPRRDQ